MSYRGNWLWQCGEEELLLEGQELGEQFVG
jgi:hypothetical protein